MALYEKNDVDLTRKALDDWYLADKKDYEIFAEKYPLEGKLQHQGVKVDAMDEWSKQTAITFTPTFFVDGHQLPELYKIGDLKHLL